MSNINTDAKYKELKERLDTDAREFAKYVQTYAEENDDTGAPEQSLFVTGWIIGIAVTGTDAEDDFDDVLYDNSAGMNNFMALGLAEVQREYYKDNARGMLGDDDGE